MQSVAHAVPSCFFWEPAASPVCDGFRDCHCWLLAASYWIKLPIPDPGARFYFPLLTFLASRLVCLPHGCMQNIPVRLSLHKKVLH